MKKMLPTHKPNTHARVQFLFFSKDIDKFGSNVMLLLFVMDPFFLSKTNTAKIIRRSIPGSGSASTMLARL